MATFWLIFGPILISFFVIGLVVEAALSGFRAGVLGYQFIGEFFWERRSK